VVSVGRALALAHDERAAVAAPPVGLIQQRRRAHARAVRRVRVGEEVDGAQRAEQREGMHPGPAAELARPPPRRIRPRLGLQRSRAAARVAGAQRHRAIGHCALRVSQHLAPTRPHAVASAGWLAAS
jgi:hypothetical protein